MASNKCAEKSETKQILSWKLVLKPLLGTLCSRDKSCCLKEQFFNSGEKTYWKYFAVVQTLLFTE